MSGSAVVSGGASGLGAAVVRRLRARGLEVVILDRDEVHGAAVAAETGAVFAAADVTDAEAVARGIEAARRLGPLRAAVTCAGLGWAARVVGRDGRPHPLDLFERIIAVNLVGTFNVARLAAAAMAELDPLPSGDRGVLVFVASIAAFEGQKGQAAYAASKAGVAGMVLPMARDLASRGIRVLGLAPGTFDTPMLRSLTPEQVQALRDEVPHPARLGDPDELARVVETFLDTPYLNGEVVRLDGALRLS
jgi:NAD(P)-dependent dehydrogenase (short-subunit alcohol dehydrogenase family)